MGVEATKNSGGRCVAALATRAVLSAGNYGLMKSGGLLLPPLPGRPVVGFQNRIQSSGRCLAPEFFMASKPSSAPAREFMH